MKDPMEDPMEGPIREVTGGHSDEHGPIHSEE